MRRITGRPATRSEAAAARFLPRPDELRKRLARTGKPWTMGQYGMVTLSMLCPTFVVGWSLGLQLLLAGTLSGVCGPRLPHVPGRLLRTNHESNVTPHCPPLHSTLVPGRRS